MEKTISDKKIEISELIAEFKELINLHRNRLPNHLVDGNYFYYTEQDLNDMDDFENLKQLHFHLGVEFREFVREYNIKHSLISENSINMFLKKKHLILFYHKNLVKN